MMNIVTSKVPNVFVEPLQVQIKLFSTGNTHDRKHVQSYWERHAACLRELRSTIFHQKCWLAVDFHLNCNSKFTCNIISSVSNGLNPRQHSAKCRNQLAYEHTGMLIVS